MRYTILVLALLGLIGCSQSPSNLAPDSAAVTVSLPNDLELGEPIHCGALTVIPVSSKLDEQDYADYVSLAEAKKNGWIEIVEVPGMETVETLTVRYSGPRSMILFAGELLLGGKQDRVVAKDTIVKPGSSTEVMVYCVEPGRWHGESLSFDAQESQVPLDVKEQAITGDQQEVWAKVGEVNAKAAPRAEGSSLRYGYKALSDSAKFRSDLDVVVSQLRKNKKAIGIVIAIGGKIHSFEYFQSPRLFAASFEPIVRGAVASAHLEDEASGTPDMNEVADFVSRCLASAKSVPASASETMSQVEDKVNGVAGGVTNLPGRGDKAGATVHGTFYDKK